VADVAAASTNRLVEMLLPPEENQPFQIFRLVCPRQP
jgi:hypothetical protein